MTYIFDIDGTLADLSHRLHFIQTTPPNWKDFFAACGDDIPIPEVIAVAKGLSRLNPIVLVTGRSDEIRDKTRSWLAKHQIYYEDLYMRKAGDHREDCIVKAELLELVLRDYPSSKIGGVFEDRQQVVDMYRARGIRVFQVAEGKF